MLTFRHACALALAACAFALAPQAQAARAYDSCTGFIDALPAVITTQGTWCLRKDLATSLSSGFAITINTNNVTIDCNDFKIGGLAAGVSTEARGIVAQERQNITVRNCNVRGFHTGIYLQGGNGGGHLVERNRLSGNTTNGIFVEGDGSTIDHNFVLDTGGAYPGHGDAIVGIVALGSVDITDNLVSGAASAAGTNQWAGGILLNNAAGVGASVRGNRIRGLFPDGSGLATGIFAGDGFTVIADNQVEGRGMPFDTAIVCNAENTSVYRGNAVSRFGFPPQRCVDGGDNIVLSPAGPPP